jgi:hypothetical protein
MSAVSEKTKRKVLDALHDTGLVYWQSANLGKAADLRAVTCVYENGTERSKSLGKFYFDTSLGKIVSIQKQFPKIIGFNQLLDSAWGAGALRVNISEILQTIGEK